MGASQGQPESQRAYFYSVQGIAKRLRQRAVSCEQCTESVSWSYERFTRREVHEPEAFQICEVKDQREASARCVAGRRHPKLIGSAWLDLAREADRRMLATPRLRHAIAVGIEEHRLSKVRIEPGCRGPSPVEVLGHGIGIQAMQLSEEGVDQPPTH